MTTRDLYGLAIRLGGAVFWVFGAFALLHVAEQQLGVPVTTKYTVAQSWLIAAGWFILGLLITFGADFLTRVAYGRKSS
jgi:hypothetical protein